MVTESAIYINLVSILTVIAVLVYPFVFQPDNLTLPDPKFCTPSIYFVLPLWLILQDVVIFFIAFNVTNHVSPRGKIQEAALPLCRPPSSQGVTLREETPKQVQLNNWHCCWFWKLIYTLSFILSLALRVLKVYPGPDLKTILWDVIHI